MNGHIDTSLRSRLTQEEEMSLDTRLHRRTGILGLISRPSRFLSHCRWPGNEANSCGRTQCMYLSGYECTCLGLHLEILG